MCIQKQGRIKCPTTMYSVIGLLEVCSGKYAQVGMYTYETAAVSRDSGTLHRII